MGSLLSVTRGKLFEFCKDPSKSGKPASLKAAGSEGSGHHSVDDMVRTN